MFLTKKKIRNDMEHWKNLSLKNVYAEINGIWYNEEWRSIPDYEGIYEASSFGRIKSLKRIYYSGAKHSHKKCAQEQIIAQK